jgi:hypothetical protein
VQRRDIKAVGALAGDASGVVTTLVRDMHAGIASRVFAAVGPPSRPTQIIHDGIALAVYAAVDTGCAGRPAWVAPLRLRCGGAKVSSHWNRVAGRRGPSPLSTVSTETRWPRTATVWR